MTNGGQLLSASGSSGHALSAGCRRGPCGLTGALLNLEFPAESFSSDTVTIQVMPPEGDPVSVNFDPARLR